MTLNVVHDTIDDIPEPFRELYTERDGKFHLTGVAGVKTQGDVDRLQTALGKEREDHKATKEKLGGWGELTPDEVYAKLDKIKELEVAASGNREEMEAKLEELTEARVGSRLAPVARENDALKKQVATLAEQNEAYKLADVRRAIQEQIRSVASEQKVVAHALPDVELLAQSVFERTEDGAFLTKENPHGISPGLDAAGFLAELQPKRPHWWPTSNGGGASGSGGAGVFGKNPFTADNWNMTEQAAIARDDPKRAEQLAAAAGTTVGGLKPVKK